MIYLFKLLTYQLPRPLLVYHRVSTKFETIKHVSFLHVPLDCFIPSPKYHPRKCHPLGMYPLCSSLGGLTRGVYMLAAIIYTTKNWTWNPNFQTLCVWGSALHLGLSKPVSFPNNVLHIIPDESSPCLSSSTCFSCTTSANSCGHRFLLHRWNLSHRIWLVVWIPLKKISQLGWLFPIQYMEK